MPQPGFEHGSFSCRENVLTTTLFCYLLPILQFDERPMPASPWDINKICLDNLAQSNAITIDIEGNQSREKYQFNRLQYHLYLSRTRFNFLFPTVCDITNQVFQLWWSIIWFFAVTFLENNTSIIAIKFLNLPLWKSSARFEICPGFHIL